MRWVLQVPRYASLSDSIVERFLICADYFQAQKLRGPVTTTIKLRYNPEHHVYILREIIPNPPMDPRLQSHQFKFEPLRLPGEFAIGGLAGDHQSEKVVAVGMIKVGRKSLFVVVSIISLLLLKLLTEIL
jgi:hypothetical protein